MKSYEVVIVGGGINGCGLIRDLALNGVSTLLIDKGDFASQTSQGSSKMLHGGIRYLENADFALVQEALEEKNLWLKLTPHLCFERDFYLPLYDYSKYKPWMLRCGLFLYDFLSHFQNKAHDMLNPEETVQKIPSLEPKGLMGAGKYYDGVVDDAKLTLECLYDALLEPCANALSYHEVISTVKVADGYEVTYQSMRTPHKETVKAKFVVFTTGPFTDKLLPKLNVPWTPQLAPSKGIHLWLKEGSVDAKGSVVLTTKDNRVVFVIPQRHSILVGTTETPVDQDMFNIKATEKEVNYLLDVLRQYFPNSNLTKDSIISTFAGVRPLVREEGAPEALGKVSRFHKIFRPDQFTYVMLGGKYTTFRRMTQELAQEIVPRLGKAYHPNYTLNPLRQHSVMPTFGEQPKLTLEMVKKIIITEYVTTFEDLVKRRLSILDEPHHLKDVMGLPVDDVKALFR
ncbi:glycerol-3-phosphate dehydrogenase/oxidase [Peredibacter starrii]|uniref:Glycerol-3-phosphate dehydrogenase/oxidase n=1 Tax=Peredibacter starrii TaxID=28202 RepID=A0AAX4HIT9_9BACT|nr:glycerol-3-phosphate dehydrogenase/oxidase [Peredibacter starrii]WPU63155.1 glycerol-3-phosphate dehydrogenase/oxidase [Peredibacter starrii]